MHSNPIAEVLDSIALAAPVAVENLTMVPLVASRGECSACRPVPLDYAVLDDALASGASEITEISEQGSVPELRVRNSGDSPVLIVDGEELVGAKQNRVVNLTILVAAHSTLTIPVSCVEAGRWRSRSRAFSSAPRTQYASGRARRVAQVSYSMVARGTRVSDQADVWADIAEKTRRLKATSPTAAMEGIYVDHAPAIDRFVARCQAIDGQVGALFAIDGAIVALDLFDRPATLGRMLPKLVRGLAVDALDARAAAPQPARTPLWLDDAGTTAAGALVEARARQFLAVVGAAPQHSTKALGLGDDVRVTEPRLAAAALVLDHHVVHLSAFAM